VLVHISQALQGLVDYVANVDFIEGFLSVFHQLVHILLHELKHKVELVVLLNNLEQSHNVRMPELYQRFYLRQRNAVIPLGVHGLHLLYSYHLTSCLVDRLRHRSKCTISEHLSYLIFFHR
jgi:hypothetical protein